MYKTAWHRAHERRHTGIVTSCGVSLSEIQHGIGIGKTTIAYLLAPPHKGYCSAERYKSYIDARVPGKMNYFREHHPDQHYLFARVRYRQEFAQTFVAESCIFFM